MLTAKLSDVVPVIKSAFRIKRPIFLWGPPGIGKSDIVNQVANDMGAPVIDMRLSQMDPTDIRGIPYHNKEINKMVWAEPFELPSAEFCAQYPIVVLFLDEMNSAVPAMMAAAYQLILNRRIGTYKLPDNVVIIAAGNHEGDRGVTYKMPAPLANRFIHIEIIVDYVSWETWAYALQPRPIHSSVIGYLSYAKADLFKFDSKNSDKAFATPRSWEVVSDIMYDSDNSSDTTKLLVSGTIGSGTANGFLAFNKMTSKLPRPADILAGNVSALETKEISAQYFIISACISELIIAHSRGEDLTTLYDNFIGFTLSNLQTELCVMGVRNVMRSIAADKLNIMSLPNYKKFVQANGKFVI